MTRTRMLVAALIVGIGVLSGAIAIVVADDGTSSTSETIEQPSEAAIGKLPVAPSRERVDLEMPSFSDPTAVTNPLHPTRELASELLLGTVDGEPLRVEITLLPERRLIEWNGERVETLVAQYVAYLDGRIHEVALDFYAQADDGSVWYFGEDVFNYENGVVADTEGTWLAGLHGPAAMIMPADPKAGNVYRPENMPGFVFEEVTVKSVGKTVEGPRGPVDGAVVVSELHIGGSYESKTFAPGYGEFYTGSGGDVEALAVAVPIDALPQPVPGELDALSAGSAAVFGAARTGDWPAAEEELDRLTEAWGTLAKSGAPPLLATQTTDALDSVSRAVGARDRAEAGQAAVALARASLDLQLRHRPAAQIDIARFDLRAVQLLLDAEAGDLEAAAGDLADLEWVRDRFVHTLAGGDLFRLDPRLDGIRAAVNEDDPEATKRAAARLREAVAKLSTGTQALPGFAA
jgi:hypothetical protein